VSDRDEEQLGDAVARRDLELDCRVRVEHQDPDLSSIAGVDQTRGVDERDPVPDRHARAWENEAADALRDLHGQPRADADPSARCETRRFGRVEVEAGVVVVGAGGQGRLLAELHELELAKPPVRRALLGDGHGDRPTDVRELSLRRPERVRPSGRCVR